MTFLIKIIKLYVIHLFHGRVSLLFDELIERIILTVSFANIDICFKTVFDFPKADFDELRDHFSNYNDWTLLINLDINEGWNLIKNRICDGMIKFIPRVTLKNNKELKPKWINNKVKRCLQKIYTYYLKYIFYLRHNYTTDEVTCGKHYEEYVKHRNIANSEKRKSRKQYEINIAEKCTTDPIFF